MRSLLLASGFAALGLADLAWIDLGLAPALATPKAVATPNVVAKMVNVERAQSAPISAPVARSKESTGIEPPSSPLRAEPGVVTGAAPRPIPPKMVLHFEVDAHEPSAAARRDAETAVGLLSADPTLVVIVDGHADRTGAPSHNDRLSRERADMIAAMLVASGVAPSRISTNGHGARRPIAPGNDEASLARNRRVELSFERRRP